MFLRFFSCMNRVELFNMNILWANFQSQVFCYTRIKIHNFQSFFLYWVIYKQVRFIHVVIANCLKRCFASYQFCEVVNQVREGVKINFIPIWKVSCNNPHLIWGFYPWYMMIMIIFLHINTPWIKQYYFICRSPFSTNLVILVQATICIYHVRKSLKLSNEKFWHDIHFKSSSFPEFCVQSMGASPTGASPIGSTPTTIYILMHNFIISYREGFNLSLLKRAKNYL